MLTAYSKFEPYAHTKDQASEYFSSTFLWFQVCRSSGIYDIGKSYNRFRELHKFNKLSEEEWLKIDEAYEVYFTKECKMRFLNEGGLLRIF